MYALSGRIRLSSFNPTYIRLMIGYKQGLSGCRIFALVYPVPSCHSWMSDVLFHKLIKLNDVVRFFLLMALKASAQMLLVPRDL